MRHPRKARERRTTQKRKENMFASYLIIAGVLMLIAGHLTLVHRMFMRSEPRVCAPAHDLTKSDLPQTAAAAPDCQDLATAV